MPYGHTALTVAEEAGKMSGNAISGIAIFGNTVWGKQNIKAKMP